MSEVSKKAPGGVASLLSMIRHFAKRAGASSFMFE